MKLNRTIAERQNDPEALTLIRASYHCLRNEQIIKYFMIVLSIGICIAAIINKYLDLIFAGVKDIAAWQESISIYLNLISGVIVVLGIVLGFYTSRMHAEGTALRDRYDAYVFDNQPNHAMLRPVSSAYISIYSKKVHKTDDKFFNYIYDNEPVKNESCAQYEYIKNEVHSDYKLYLSIQPFFLTLWIGFVILIIIIAVSFNDKFIMTLINIMIPSLSAISMIGSSWHGSKQQMKQLMVLINVIDQIESMPATRKLEYIKDRNNMRILADGLLNYRASAFIIPNFLVKRHQKNMMKSKAELTGSETLKLNVSAYRKELAATSSQSYALVPKKSSDLAIVPVSGSLPTVEQTVADKKSMTDKHLIMENKSVRHTKKAASEKPEQVKAGEQKSVNTSVGKRKDTNVTKSINPTTKK